MVSVREACQGLADGDDTPAESGRAQQLDTEGEKCAQAEQQEQAEVPSEGVAGMALVEEQGTGRVDSAGGGAGVPALADREEKEAGTPGEALGGVETGLEVEGVEGGDGGAVAGQGAVDEDDRSGGVPLSISCSEDGKTVAVVVSG